MVAGVLKQFHFSIPFSGTTVHDRDFFVIGNTNIFGVNALTGSLVSNQEQGEQAAMPISMLGLVGYFITIAAQSGDSMLAQIASYVPFLCLRDADANVTGRASMGEAWIGAGVTVGMNPLNLNNT